METVARTWKTRTGGIQKSPKQCKNMRGVTPEEAYRIICDDIRAIYREP